VQHLKYIFYGRIGNKPAAVLPQMGAIDSPILQLFDSHFPTVVVPFLSSKHSPWNRLKATRGRLRPDTQF